MYIFSFQIWHHYIRLNLRIQKQSKTSICQNLFVFFILNFFVTVFKLFKKLQFFPYHIEPNRVGVPMSNVKCQMLKMCSLYLCQQNLLECHTCDTPVDYSDIAQIFCKTNCGSILLMGGGLC
ncbi:hypothetical protein BpHYR1_053150 [Brachionus plicatilis]|uniref:Uncharacterized protein n=1 Tax=Brachionus plicatilis TaxID=10195 RepID=A0A3M7QCK5_BRAPC|nr:hypothetical protein BpHYR1_053150 [Brachionus plicatilis]